MTRLIAALLIAISFAVTSPFHAAAEPRDWRIDADKSELAIVYIINGENRRGAFSRFSGDARFDAEDLTTAEMEFLIETASIDTGDSFGTEVVRGVDWLDVEGHPTARYVLTSLEPLGGDRYRAVGDLTLRGKTETVVGEMTLALTEETADASGATEFDRKAFRVGVGFTTLFVDVGDRIAVSFDLVATPKG